jgi:TldD protein
MQKDKQIESSYVARSFRNGFEWLTNDLVDQLAYEVIDRTNILFEATKPKAGEMPVVMGAGGSGILLHEAIGHTFEADFNRKGTSIFSDKLGKKVAENFINIIDDGTLPNNRGSINIDDEGNESRKTYLVKDGILNSYIHDRISAKFYKVDPTGNGRRESFRNIPLPRMRATYMEPGSVSKDDIISQVDYGVFVDNFSNGQVQIGAGDFTFFVKSGYLIEKGKLTIPIKDINIIGNGPKALADITMAANDYAIDNGTWTCGKDGQSVPVTCGLPTVLVKKLTVGGTN